MASTCSSTITFSSLLFFVFFFSPGGRYRRVGFDKHFDTALFQLISLCFLCCLSSNGCGRGAWLDHGLFFFSSFSFVVMFLPNSLRGFKVSSLLLPLSLLLCCKLSLVRQFSPRSALTSATCGAQRLLLFTPGRRYRSGAPRQRARQ